MNVNTENLAKNCENWASIDGYINYEVSWFGRVRNAATGRILKARTSPLGYRRVNLYIDGKQKTHAIHQLVAREWVPNPGEKRCVDHIDGSRTNNNWENLRYATASENGMNAKNRTDGSSVYKGVSYQTQAKKWKAAFGMNSKRIYLGLFESEREAAEAYNAAAVLHYKEFARLNVFED